MKKTKWVLTWLLTLILILSTSVGYAKPEEAAETTEITDQEILQGLQLPADTPVEQVQEENSDERHIIETPYGNFVRCNPEDVPADKREELMARLQNSGVSENTIDSNNSTSQLQGGEVALPSQNSTPENSPSAHSNAYVLNPSNDATNPHFSISTTSPYGVPIENPSEITITSNVGSIQSLELYIDNVEIASITAVTANLSWKASVSDLTKGTHVLRVVGYTTNPDDPDTEAYITEGII